MYSVPQPSTENGPVTHDVEKLTGDCIFSFLFEQNRKMEGQGSGRAGNEEKLNFHPNSLAALHQQKLANFKLRCQLSLQSVRNV